MTPTLLTWLAQHTVDLPLGAQVDQLPQEVHDGLQESEHLMTLFGLEWASDGVLVKGRQTTWSVSWVRLDQNEAWRALFKSAFDQTVGPEWLAWKYHQTPEQMGVGVWSGDRLVAFYGGLPRRIRYLGQDAMAVQICDVMVDPDQRGVLTKKGPFFLASSTYLELMIGDGRPYLLGFGFPSRRHMVLAERLGLNEPVDEIVQINWRSKLTGWNWQKVLYASRPIQEDDQAVVDDLWAEMKADFRSSIVGVRDFKTIWHRYRAHPDRPYQVRLVFNRWTGRAIGLTVTRDRDADHAELLDLVAPRCFFRRLARLTQAELAVGGRQLFVWVTRSHADVFSGLVGDVQETEVMVPTNTWSPGLSVEAVSGKWFLLGGDSDFR